MHRESCQENIVKHVYDSDEGYTLGASIDYITGNKGSDGKIRLAEDNYILSRSDEAKYSNTYMSEERRTQDLISKSYKYGVVFGGRNGDGYTFATIGKGEVRCTESGIGKVCEIEKANRDVSKTSSFDYDYKIETIRAKFSALDEETKKKAIENLKSGKFFENIATSFMSAIGEVKDALGNILPNKDSTNHDVTSSKEYTEDQAQSKTQENNEDTTKNLSILEDIDKQLIEKYPNLKDDEYIRLATVKLAYDLEKNNLVLNRKDGIEVALVAVNKYLEENPIIRPAALPLIVMGIGQAIRACAMNPACVKTVMEISIGAAALFGMKFTVDKLKDESYKSIKSDDSNDKNEQSIKQNSGSAAATGTPDPDDDFDFDPDDWEKNKEERFHHPEAKDIKGIHNKPNVNNPQLRKALDQLYKPTDNVAGGTAGKLREEIIKGLPKEHLKKAGERIVELKRIINNEPLSRTDRKIAERVIHDLRSAIKQAGGL